MAGTSPAMTGGERVISIAKTGICCDVRCHLHRHARACRGHPRLSFFKAAEDVDGQDITRHFLTQ